MTKQFNGGGRYTIWLDSGRKFTFTEEELEEFEDAKVAEIREELAEKDSYINLLEDENDHLQDRVSDLEAELAECSTQ